MESNEIIVVVGGSGDIGLSIVQELLSKNYNILYTYNKTKPDKNLFSESENAKVRSFQLDVRDSSSTEKLKEYIQNNNLKIKGLVYNTGIIKDSLFFQMTEEDFSQVLDVNLLGCFRICKALIGDISVNRGNIVIISSIAGLLGKTGQVNYSCSKAALIALARNLAMEYARLGVRVNAIAPGLIKTKMLEEMPKVKLDEMKKGIPLKRLGEPLDIANSVNFLLSNQSNYITGQTLVIDGGILMR